VLPGEWNNAELVRVQSDEDMTMPVMLVFADSDMFRSDHIVDFYRRLGGGPKDARWQREQVKAGEVKWAGTPRRR
jgi:hypothetical protein